MPLPFCIPSVLGLSSYGKESTPLEQTPLLQKGTLFWKFYCWEANRKSETLRKFVLEIMTVLLLFQNCFRTDVPDFCLI